MTLARCDHSAGMDDEYPIVAEREYEHGTFGGDAGAIFPHTDRLYCDGSVVLDDWLFDV